MKTRRAGKGKHSNQERTDKVIGQVCGQVSERQVRKALNEDNEGIDTDQE